MNEAKKNFKMFLSLFYVKNNVNWYLKYAIILFIYAKNYKNIIPVIEGSAVVHHFPCFRRQGWLFVRVGWKYSCVSLQPIVNFNRDVPQKVNHCTAFNDRYNVFFIFSVNK